MGFRHIVLLTLDERCDVGGLVDDLRAMGAGIPELRSYAVGRDAGLSEGNATVAIVADCDDEAGWVAYRDNADHQRMIAERIKPHLLARTAVQHVT